MGDIEVEEYGKTTAGQLVHKFTLTNKYKVTVEIISLGGAVVAIKVPDKTGKIDDITTGFPKLQDYETNKPHFGVLVGRFANRIHKGLFVLDRETYQLAVNNGPNHLHGGLKGFAKKVWQWSLDRTQLRLKYVSADGEESYPGQVTVNVTYELNDDNELVIDYTATTTKATPINMTNHAYFNLGGHKSGKIYDHIISINADKFTPKNEDGVPTGEIANVAGTVFDLRKPTLLRERIHNIPDHTGYDHNFCVNGEGDKKLAARVEHEKTGRVFEVYTNQPGVQLYTGNFLDNFPGKDGVVYNQHDAFCLETQNYPDAINQPNFPSCIVRPGEMYKHTCWYKFMVKSTSSR